MVKSKRYCLFENHNKNLVEYICIQKQCKSISRWHCRECFQINLHQHGMDNNQHIVKIHSLTIKLEIQVQLLEEQIKEQSNLQQQFILGINEIKKNIDQLTQLSADWEKEISNNHNLIELQTFFNNLKVNQQAIDDDTLMRLSLFKLDEIEYTQQHKIFKDLSFSIKQQQIQIERLKYYQESNNQKYTHNYQYIQTFIQTDGFLENINTASISKDEQYLAYGGNGWKIYIYDINKQKKIIELETKGIITASQFSQDSLYLVIGDADGNLYCYNTKNEFKQKFLTRIHNSSINQIYFKSHNVLTCSYDQQIIETDINNQKQLLRIHDAHKNSINSLVYDKSSNFIISGSSDKCIKFFNSEGKQIIVKQDAHQFQISQIQLIEQQQKLISHDIQGNLKIWLINYQNMTLWETSSFSEQETIYNFLSLNNNQYLLLICNNYIKIIDDQGNRKKIIKYEGDISNSIRNIQQLESLNHIIILQSKGLLLLTKKE